MRGRAQPRRVDDDEYRPNRPRRWGTKGYLVLIVLAIIIACAVLIPLGAQVRGVFQKLSDALGGAK
jgi:hypothetical protein